MASLRKMDGAQSWTYLVIAGLALALNAGAALSSFGIFVVVFSEYFNETNSKIGWVGAAGYSIQSIIYPIPVYLRRRYGFRAVMSFAAVMFSLAHITTPFAPSANYLFLTYSLPLALCSAMLDCLSVMTMREYFHKYRSWVIGMRFAFIMMGAISFNYLLPVFIDAIGWRKTFWCLSSIGVVILVYAFTYQSVPLDEEKRTMVLMDNRGADENFEKKEKTRHFLRNKRFLLVCCGCLLQAFILLVPPMFMVQYAITLGYPLSKAKYLLLSYSSGSLIGRLTGGVLSDVSSKQWNICYSVGANFILYGASSALITQTTNLWLLIVYMGVIGYLSGTFYLMVLVMMNDVTSGINVDYAYSVAMIFMGIGFLLGPPALGWLYDVTGDFRLVLYAVAACITFAGVLMIVGTFATLKCDGPQQLQQSVVEETTDCVKTMSQEKYILIVMKETAI